MRVEVARLRPAGALDTTFGAGGFAELAVAPGDTMWANAIAPRPDGGVMVLSDDPFGPDAISVWALTESGAPEAAFDGDGVARFQAPAPLESQFQGRDLSVDAQDRVTVLAAGLYRNPNSLRLVSRPVLMRLTTAGALDPSFGDGRHRDLEPAVRRVRARSDADRQVTTSWWRASSPGSTAVRGWRSSGSRSTASSTVRSGITGRSRTRAATTSRPRTSRWRPTAPS